MSLILVNDMNARTFPSQTQSTLNQIILTHGTGRVISDLYQGGLTYIDQSISLQVFKLDFAALCMRRHHTPPFSLVEWALLGQARGELQAVLRVELPGLEDRSKGAPRRQLARQSELLVENW